MAQHLSVYLLFQYLIEANWATNYLRDTQLERFMNEMLIPAIEKHCATSITQHLRSSFQMAKYNSQASGLEPTTRAIRTASRSQLLHYHLPFKYLNDIWTTLCQISHQPGLDFCEAIIFVNAKNWKLATMEPLIKDSIRTFREIWNSSCDSNYFSDESVWVDIATEFVHSPGSSPAGDIAFPSRRLSQFPRSGSEQHQEKNIQNSTQKRACRQRKE